MRSIGCSLREIPREIARLRSANNENRSPLRLRSGYADIKAHRLRYTAASAPRNFHSDYMGDYNSLVTATALNHVHPLPSPILSLLSENPLPQEFNKPRAAEEREEVLRILPVR